MTQETAPTTAPAPATTAAPVPAAPAAPETVAPVTIGEPSPAPAAPVAAAAPAAEPEEKFAPSGDVALDVAYSFIGKLGIKPSDPAVKAAQTGDFSLIRAKLSAMGDKAAGWQEHVELAQASYTRAHTAATEAAKKTAEAVYGVVGGKDTWEQVQTWASANASEAEKAELNASFAAGGLAAKAAARYLHDLWSKKSGQAAHKPAASANAGTTQAVDSGPLSAKDYSNAVADLTRKFPGKDISRLPEYNALQNRRIAGKRAGL